MNVSLGAPTCAVVSHNGFLNRRFRLLAKQGRVVTSWAQSILIHERSKITHGVSYDLVEIPAVQFPRAERSLLTVERFALGSLEHIPVEVPLLFLEQREDRLRKGVYVFCLSVIDPDTLASVLFVIEHQLNSAGCLGVRRRNFDEIFPEETTFVFCAPP